MNPAGGRAKPQLVELEETPSSYDFVGSAWAFAN
jgi:hypothetical protein